MTPLEAIEVAESVARDGFAPHESRVAELARWARAAGCSKALTDSLGDLTAPPVLRTRALGRVTRVMAADRGTGSALDRLRPGRPEPRPGRPEPQPDTLVDASAVGRERLSRRWLWQP